MKTNIMLCRVCDGHSEYRFSAQVLQKYSADYYRCKICGLMQTDESYWLEESYSSAITDLDVGLVQRNIRLARLTGKILSRYFDPEGRFLDYAGGYGLFVRLMRDNGFDFYSYDKYCDNIFSKFFTHKLEDNSHHKFELITAFEVMEHIVNPIEELRKLLEMSDTVLFTTLLIPADFDSVDDWWYFTPETGQHLTFYTSDSLDHLAKILCVHYISDGEDLHIFSRNAMSDFSFGHDERSATAWQRLNRFLFSRKKLNKNTPSRNKHVSTEQDFAYIREVMAGK